jgi:hypothetical protein
MKNIKSVPLSVVVVALIAGIVQVTFGVESQKRYANMAPLDQYLMTDRDAEIALAKSAAPAIIAKDSTVMVLGRHGYEVAVSGKNGFVCLVERSWMSPFDFPEFWNPKMRGPLCFNPPAVRSILPLTYKRTDLVLSGVSKAQLFEKMKSERPIVEAGAMTFMFSKQQYLNDGAGNWVPHMMFYFPKTDGATWGADVPGSPIMLNPQFNGNPEPITLIMIPASRWSDGSDAPRMNQ